MDYSLPLILLVFVGFIFFSNRRRKTAASQLEKSIAVGAKAVMLGGITGTITEIRETTLVVETFPGTKIEFLKLAVRSVESPNSEEIVEEKPVLETPKAKTPATEEVNLDKKAPVKKPAAKKSVE